jgi:anti-sigma B factor antagonist
VGNSPPTACYSGTAGKLAVLSPIGRTDFLEESVDSRPDSARSVDPGAAGSSCTLEERRVDQVSVVGVTGVVDMLTAPELEKAIAEAARSSPIAVVVDMTGVEFLASAGMGVLIAAQDELTPAIRFAVVAEGPATSRPLKLVGVTDVVDLYATLDGALSALKS